MQVPRTMTAMTLGFPTMERAPAMEVAVTRTLAAGGEMGRVGSEPGLADRAAGREPMSFTTINIRMMNTRSMVVMGSASEAAAMAAAILPTAQTPAGQ